MSKAGAKKRKYHVADQRTVLSRIVITELVPKKYENLLYQILVDHKFSEASCTRQMMIIAYARAFILFLHVNNFRGIDDETDFEQRFIRQTNESSKIEASMFKYAAFLSKPETTKADTDSPAAIAAFEDPTAVEEEQEEEPDLQNKIQTYIANHRKT